MIDDWPAPVPLTEAGLEVFERWFGDLSDELFGSFDSFGIRQYAVYYPSRRSAMARPASEIKTTRLEARIPVHVYEQMQRAAKLRGMTLTGYLIATAGEDARRTIEEADVLRLAAEDQVRFAKALIDPPAPNARLARAARRHTDLIAPR